MYTPTDFMWGMVSDREGYILSPFLFNLYMDELSCRLNKCNIGCICGDLRVNHLMYADDLVVVCSYSGGMQTLLKICTEYGYEFDIKYNSTKSNVLVVRNKTDKHLKVPDLVHLWR